MLSLFAKARKMQMETDILLNGGLEYSGQYPIVFLLSTPGLCLFCNHGFWSRWIICRRCWIIGGRGSRMLAMTGSGCTTGLSARVGGMGNTRRMTREGIQKAVLDSLWYWSIELLLYVLNWEIWIYINKNMRLLLELCN